MLPGVGSAVRLLALLGGSDREQGAALPTFMSVFRSGAGTARLTPLLLCEFQPPGLTAHVTDARALPAAAAQPSVCAPGTAAVQGTQPDGLPAALLAALSGMMQGLEQRLGERLDRFEAGMVKRLDHIEAGMAQLSGRVQGVEAALAREQGLHCSRGL